MPASRCPHQDACIEMPASRCCVESHHGGKHAQSCDRHCGGGNHAACRGFYFHRQCDHVSRNLEPSRRGQEFLRSRRSRAGLTARPAASAIPGCAACSAAGAPAAGTEPPGAANSQGRRKAAFFCAARPSLKKNRLRTKNKTCTLLFRCPFPPPRAIDAERHAGGGAAARASFAIQSVLVK